MAPVFRGEKVQQVFGDLFSPPDDYALAHCVGADLRMGKGIAVDFKQRYGHVDYLLQQRKVAGQVAVLPAKMCGKTAPIFYLVSKSLSTAYGSRWEDFCSCLQELRRLCLEMGVKKVAMPRIGCSNDHLSWPSVEKELYKTFHRSAANVLVFTPPSVPGCLPLVSLQPTFRGWQLLGDSNMVRFSTNYGTYDKNPRERYPKQLGLCISGQRMKSLLLLLQQHRVQSDVIVMIGTNDILQIFRHMNLSLDIKLTLRATFAQLCNVLANKCRRVLLVTLPPIPAHPECQQYLGWLNGLIVKAADHYVNVKVLNWTPFLFTADNNIDVSRYEQWMGPPGKQRKDLIHLNGWGHCLLKSHLEAATAVFQL